MERRKERVSSYKNDKVSYRRIQTSIPVQSLLVSAALEQAIPWTVAHGGTEVHL